MKDNAAKWDSVEIKNFCSAKDTIKRIKDKPQMGKKYLQNTPDKKVLFKYTKTFDVH